MKKESLTLAQLASYDDLLTDALVDRIYFWSTIRKNRTRYAACRGIREEDITNILHKTIVLEKDAIKACGQLLELPGLKRFNERLSPDEREHFQRHLRKYVSIYLPDCPFEVTTTNRYTIDTAEAAVTARKVIQKGELIKYLSGVQVPITKEEEQDLDLTRRDFSIVMSSRKRTPSLFLGPARFANHDCDANARLTTRGSSGMAVVAAKDIAIGEEVTVSYGDDYFGINNCECLCRTCEELLRNGWAPSLAQSIEAGTPRSVQHPQNIKDRRLYDISRATPSTGPSLTPDSSHTPSRKRKLGERNSPHVGTSRPDTMRPGCGPSQRSMQQHLPSNLAQELLPGITTWDQSQDHISTPGRSISPISALESSRRASPVSYASTAATSMSENTPAPKEEFVEKELTATLTASFPAIFAPEVDEATIITFSEPPASHDVQTGVGDSESELSDLPEDLQFDDTLQQLVAVKGPTQVRVTRRTLASLPRKEKHLLLAVHGGESIPNDTELIAVAVAENARKPGDYTLAARLLAVLNTRWGTCKVCSDHFAQTETGLTRWSCPRCERHSKLYGYQWPKTDKAGKHDLEERVMDHREVHRYVWSEEEKTMKKGRKSRTEMLQELLEEQQRINEAAMSSMDDRGSETPRKRRPTERSRYQEELSATESPTPRKRKVVRDGTGMGRAAKKVKTVEPVDSIYDFTATPYQSPTSKKTKASLLKPAATSTSRTSNSKQRTRPTSDQTSTMKPKPRPLPTPSTTDTAELIAIKSNRRALKSSPLLTMKPLSTTSETKRKQLDRLYGRPTTSDISEISDSAPSTYTGSVGVLKRPTRKASMGIAAAIAAEIESESEGEGYDVSPRKGKRRVGKVR